MNGKGTEKNRTRKRCGPMVGSGPPEHLNPSILLFVLFTSPSLKR
jgi:hypothetical protein